MSILLFALLLASGDADVQTRFDYAAKCRVHTQMLPDLSNDPKMKAAGRKIFSYWTKESDRLGKELGFNKEQLEWKYLVIPITADVELLQDCSSNAKGVFKDK